MSSQRLLFLRRLSSMLWLLVLSFLSTSPGRGERLHFANPVINQLIVTKAPFCPGEHIEVKFDISGYDSQSFEFYLSDPTGTTFPTSLKSVNLTTSYASFDLNTSMPLGAGYRVRLRLKTVVGTVAEKISEPFSIVTPVLKPLVQQQSICLGQSINIDLKVKNNSFAIYYGIELSDSQGNFSNDKKNVGGTIYEPGQYTVDLTTIIKAGTYRARTYAVNLNAGIKTILYSEPSEPFQIHEFSYAGPPSLSGVPSCPGGTIGITFNSACDGVTPEQGTVSYHVLLSDAQGDFTNAQEIGLLTQTGLATVKLPDGLAGDGYRIKVKSDFFGFGSNAESPASAPFSVNAQGGFVSVVPPSNQLCSGSIASVKVTLNCPFPSGTTMAVLISDATGQFDGKSVLPGFVALAKEFNTPLPLIGYNAATNQTYQLPDGNQYKLRFFAYLPDGSLQTIDSAPFSINSAACSSQPLQVTPKQLTAFSATTATPSATQALSIQHANSNAPYTYQFSIPEEFEVSGTESDYVSGAFSVSPPLSSYLKFAPLHVRLRAGLPVGEYKGTLVVSIGLGTGETVYVPVSGMVTDGGPNPFLNQPPVYNGLFTGQTVQDGNAVNIQLPLLAFTDPEGQTITWSAKGLPNGLFLSGQNLMGTAPAPGTYPIIITATDPGGLSASGTFTLTIKSANEQNPGEGQSLQLLAPDYNCQTGAFTFKTQGGDGSPIEYYAVPGITGWTTNPNQYVDYDMRTVADAPGITLRARQSGKEVSLDWNIRAVCPVGGQNPGGGNSLQLLAPDYSCQTGAITFKTQGGNGGPIEFFGLGITGWSTNPNGVIDAEKRSDPKSGTTIILKARQNGVEVSYSFDFGAYCQSKGVNLPPTVNLSQPSQTGRVGQYFSYKIPDGTFSDPESGPLTLGIQGLPVGLSQDGAESRLIKGVPLQAGSFVVTLTATDAQGAQTSTTLQIIINPADQSNQNPSGNGSLAVAQTIPNQSGIVGQYFSFTIPVGTFSGPVASVDVSDLPQGLFYHSDTHTVEGTVNLADQRTVTVTAIDGKGGLVQTSFVLSFMTGSGRKAAGPIQEMSPLKLQVVAYPNPVVDQLTVEVRVTEGQPVRCWLVSGGGRVMSQQQQVSGVGPTQFKLDVRSMTAGVYVLQVTVPGQQKSLKIVIP